MSDSEQTDQIAQYKALVDSYGRTITELNYNMGNILKLLKEAEDENRDLKKQLAEARKNQKQQQ